MGWEKCQWHSFHVEIISVGRIYVELTSMKLSQ